MSTLDDAFQKPGDVSIKGLMDSLLTNLETLGENLGTDQFREEGLDEGSLSRVSSFISMTRIGPVTKVGAAAYATLNIGGNVRTGGGGFTVLAGQKMVVRGQFQCPNLPVGQGIPIGAIVGGRLAYSIAAVVTVLPATERQITGDNQSNIFTMDAVLGPAVYDWVEVQEFRSAAVNYNFWNGSIHGELLHRVT